MAEDHRNAVTGPGTKTPRDMIRGFTWISAILWVEPVTGVKTQ